ncbi:MAG: nucleotide exchange factor GrpE, partial [Mycoplasmataceae bacterium]|nr:nucleotide exchange factor GrpE [Mycoplasmataceae bacterium]
MGEEKKSRRPKTDENLDDAKSNKQRLKAEKKADKKEEANFKKLSSQEKIDFLQEKIKKMKSDRIIELANLDNARKQYEKDFIDRQKYAVGSFAKDILPALDTFSMALSSKNVSDEIRNWLRGFEMVKGMFDQSFELHGIKKIEVNVGDPFNSKYHHAVEHKAVTDMKHDTILKVSQSGYMIGDRLLRPAAVTVVNNNANTDSNNEGNKNANTSEQTNNNNENVASSNQPTSGSSNNVQQPTNNANVSQGTQQQANNANMNAQNNVNSQQQMNNVNNNRNTQQSVNS